METGVLLVGHGSRRRAANEELGVLAAVVGALLGVRVVPAFFQFGDPSLEAGIELLVREGREEIVVVPAFLSPGVHVEEDLPRALREIAGRYGGRVRLRVARCLGPDLRLAEVLAERALEALSSGAPVQGVEISPAEILARSREVIASLLSLEEAGLVSGPEKEVASRVVHATGDVRFAALLRFGKDAVRAGVAALKSGAPVLADVQMVAVGVNRRLLREFGGRVFCLVRAPGVQEEAAAQGITRAAAAVRRCRALLPGSVVAVGNAPTALSEVLRQAEEGYRPALVVGTPVGFVGAAQAKEQLSRSGLPYITVTGTRGGSTVAAAVVNALINLARGEPGL